MDLWMILKNSFIQIKKLYGYKLVRAVKQYELKICIKSQRRDCTRQCKLFNSCNEKANICVIYYAFK